ncbi:hypothetical protein MMC29_005526 [Sticta canariensis]|nr:hypothetical protein [Sticta canariensis]
MAKLESTDLDSSDRPYARHIEASFGSTHVFLISFLRDGYHKHYSNSRRPYVEIHVVDSVDGTLKDQLFKAPRRGAVNSDFLSALKDNSSNIRTRLVLVQGMQLADLNSAYIDAIGAQYMLDPYFFSAHLDLCRRPTDSASGRVGLPVLLPSERHFLQIVQDDYSHMTATLKKGEGRNTIIVLGMDLYHRERVTALRNELLKEYSREDVMTADDIPANYLYPYVRESARSAASLCHEHSEIKLEIDPDEMGSPFHRWHWNQANRRALITSMRNLTKFSNDPAFNDATKPSKLLPLLEDYTALIKETEVIGLDMQGHLQQIIGTQTIEETKRGLQQADSVRRKAYFGRWLTLVAFVFIPLSFSSSFFGMNIQQLGTGSIHLGYFFLLSVLAGGLAYTLTAAVKPVEGAWHRARQRFAAREWQDEIAVDSVTKSDIIWGYARRHSPQEMDSKILTRNAIERALRLAKYSRSGKSRLVATRRTTDRPSETQSTKMDSYGSPYQAVQKTNALLWTNSDAAIT